MIKALLLLLSAGKLSKAFLTGGTMILSVFAYALVFGFWYAVGFVALLFAHEMGHFLAARQRGLAVGAPTFIPFVGAWIQLKELPHDVETEAYVGIAGPVVGSAAALACYFAARETGSQLLLALAYAGCMLNLFNLIPLSPLDGGRITAIVSPKVWWVGAPLLLALFAYRPSPMLVLIGVLAIPHLLQTFRKNADGPPDAYYDVPMATRVNYGIFYVLLAGLLGVMTYELHAQLGRPI
ncbi:MAG: site-2 protease family protein [Proteobacteria bacterium]|nr:MAG: site-2 protease family protein [Pseudomonadota bacterium]